jgi:hypothetical protein
MKLEFGVLHTPDSQVSAALVRIKSTYLAALENPSLLPSLQQMIASAPQPLPGMIPNPERVLGARKDLTDKLLRARSILP